MFEERIEKAVEFFKSGYNCSQSVVLAFADMYGFTQEQAARAINQVQGQSDKTDQLIMLALRTLGGN